MLWAGEISISQHALSCLAAEIDLVLCVLRFLCIAPHCPVMCCSVLSHPVLHDTLLCLACAVIAGSNMLC